MRASAAGGSAKNISAQRHTVASNPVGGRCRAVGVEDVEHDVVEALCVGAFGGDADHRRGQVGTEHPLFGADEGWPR
jgi:hypothetical protein